MKTVYQVISRTIGLINQSLATIGITAGIALAFYNVVARYAFNASYSWAAELTTYLFIWSTFFGAAYCFKKDAHIAVTVILEKVPPYAAKALVLISHTISLIFLAAVSYYGYEYLILVIELEEMSIDLNIPMWIPYLVIPIAFALASFRVIEKIIDIIRTPAEDVVPKSEAEMALEEIHQGEMDVDDMRGYNLVHKVHKKTGGML